MKSKTLKNILVMTIAFGWLAGCGDSGSDEVSTISSVSSVSEVSQTASEAAGVEEVDNYGYTAKDHELFQEITNDIASKYLEEFKDYPESWVYVKWDDENAVATTAKFDVTGINNHAPQDVVCVFTYNPDGSYTSHFFAMADTIYETDGYADEDLAAISQLAQ